MYATYIDGSDQYIIDNFGEREANIKKDRYEEINLHRYE